MGVPQPMIKDAEYVEISAGDYHLCGLRKPLTGRLRNNSLVDCWGYNMTKNHEFDGPVQSILASYEFNCGLFALNRMVFCWGDETSSRLISLIPKEMRFRAVSARRYHVCGISEGVDSTPLCWGKSLDLEGEMAMEMMEMENSSGESTPPPSGIKVYQIAAGNYFTCGILAEKDLSTVCWGFGFPTSLPLAIPPGMCNTASCASGTYELNSSDNINNVPCKALPSASHVCLPCTNGCPPEMYEKAQCTSKSDRLCEYNCSACYSTECLSSYSSGEKNKKEKKDERGWSIQLLVIVSFAVFLAVIVSATAVLYVRYRPEIRRAQTFTYEELNKATNGFKDESFVGKGSFSCVCKGVLRNGTVVAVKKAIVSSEQQKNSKEFHTELNLLSRYIRYLDPEYYRLHYLTTKSDVYSFGVLLLEILSGRKAIDMQFEEGNIVEWAVPLIRSGDTSSILDPILKPPFRPGSTEEDSERCLQLMGSPCYEQPILPTEVVLGSSRMHKKSSQRSLNRSGSEAATEVVVAAAEGEEQRIEFRAPSWITFPSVTSSQRRKSSVSEADVDGKAFGNKKCCMWCGWECVEEFGGRDWSCFSSSEFVPTA
ncbi:unnamed protein product [Linum tenue]|uniref:non-specific serine/threonine protein kinase n=1 Tax=Linum tenue TaxID=586396 RepID=A0AAV0IJV1_9ROSI|nr:unnamed protein product [Linum tenue]